MSGSVVSAANLIHEFYVPLPEAQVRTALVSIEPASGIVGTTIESVISIVVTGPGTVIHYDQWEDGYEVDLNSPVQSTTQIWGDGNDANGKPPGYANDPASFSAGAVIVLRNQIPLPRNPATLFYDGRDRFGGTKALVVSRASWATTPGTVLCGANEVMATMDYGTSYIAPVGVDVSAASMFEFVGLFVMARDDATSVTIDTDGTGPTAAFVVTLNRGESYLVNGAVKKGATVTATKPVQVDLITGDIGARYESRRFTLYPVDQWSPTMYSPLGTASNGDTSYAFLYNPNAGSITINVLNNAGTSSFSVPSKTSYQYTLAKDSGSKFTSASSEPFFGVVTVGANPSANNVHDWGFSMLPSDNLTAEAVVGWGPGSSDLTQNGSPVWVTPVDTTRIYIDYNGDRLGSLTDPRGNKYDVHYDVAALTTKIVYDPDKDQTAMRLYTLDGTQIAAAWGQDPAVAGPSNPYLDCGTTVLPFPVPVLRKSVAIAIDNGSPGLTLNDVLEYTITVDNRGLLPLGNLLVLDPLHPSLSYVAGSTTRDGTAIADNGTTLFPLDEGGYTVPLILRSGTTTFKYRAAVTGTGTITNTASNPAYNLVVANDVVIPPGGGSTPCTIAFTNVSGVDMTAYGVGAGVYATLTDPDSNQSSSTIEQVNATVTDANTGDIEIITLVETGVNTGIFRNTTPLPTSAITGATTQNGTLYVAAGDTLTVTHLDAVYGETCSDTAVISVPTQNKFLYLTDTLALDRVDPVAASDATTANTGVLSASGVSAITVAGAAASSTTTQTASTHTFSYNSGAAGSNRILMVSVSYRNNDSETVSSVTYGGQAMTSLGTQENNTGSAPDGRIYLYRLLNPPTGANNLVVTWNSALNNGGVIGAVTYAGVDQTTPTGAFASAIGVSATPTVAVTSATNELVFGAVEGRTATDYTVTGGGTLLWTNRPFSGQTAASGQSKAGAAGVSLTWGNSTGSNLEWVAAGVSLKPAATVGNPTATFTQAPTFATTFTMPVGAVPVVQTYFTVSSGSMIASPAITARLKKNGTTFATSSSAASAGGLLTFTFPALGSAVNCAAGDAMSLEVTTAQSGVTFTVDYDSTTKPSKITLPTTTVISISSLGIYDAPYPGGVLTSAPASGTTVYVRSTATDPFGAYDITSMGLSIDGPGAGGDISTTLGAGQVVATGTATKTYQYAWTIGQTTGAYNLLVTGNEGSEGINATSATSVSVTMLDLGTPSTTEFTSTLNGSGTETYAGNATVYARVTDLDQNTNALVAETFNVVITSLSGDSELRMLTETGVNTGIFAGSVPASTTTGIGANNSTLHAVLGEVLNVVYEDPDDASDTSNDTATIPNVAPSITVNKTLLSPTDGQAMVGEELEYTIQVTNTGNTTLSSVALTDTFPAAKMTYVSASVTPNTVVAGSLTWTNVGPLTQGQSTTLTLTFTALASAAPATNTASANAGGGVTGNDTANVTITHPGLLVTKTVLTPVSSLADIGSNVTYQIALQNTGDTAIESLPLEDVFSGANFDFVSASPAPDATGSGSLLWLDVTGAGSLAAGASTNVQVVLKAKGGGAGAVNSAEVIYAIDEHDDPVPPASSTATVTVRSTTINGHVYEDLDGTGTFTAGDVGIADVTVQLFRDTDWAPDGWPDGPAIAIVTTDASGAYEFPNLAQGAYVVVESDPFGYLSTGDTQGANDNRIPVIVNSYSAFAGRDFFDRVPNPAEYGSISGKVWNDADNSRAANGSEAGLANVTVELIQDSNGNLAVDAGEPVYATTLTAPDGTYSFTMVPPRALIIRETDPAGYASSNDITNPNDNEIPVTLLAGVSLVNQDFFDTTAAIVTGHIYMDSNRSGHQDPGEPSVPQVQLIIGNYTGVDQIVTTDSNGDWTASVPPGTTYASIVKTSSGFTNVFRLHYLTPPFSAPYLLMGPVQTEGVDYSTVEAVGGTTTDGGTDGFYNGTYLSGSVFYDQGGNGVRDAWGYDYGILEMPVTVTDSTGIPQTVLADGNGYWVAVVEPGNVTIDMGDIPGVDNRAFIQTVGDDPSVAVAVADTLTFADDDGYFVRSRMVGRLYLDVNGNGHQDSGEPGLPDVEVLVTDDHGSSVTVSSDANGDWVALVTGGDVVVTANESDPDFLARVPAGSPQTEGSNPSHADGNGAMTNDAGIDGWTMTGSRSISGQVRDDFDADGALTDNDVPVASVTIKLWFDLNGDGLLDGGDVLMRTTTTDVLGNYTFTGLADSHYLVQEINPIGATSTADKVGPNDDLIPVAIAGADSVLDDFLDVVDPAGYAYDSITGQIIAGGSILVSGPGAVTILQDGSSGQYSFITDGTPGSYTITYSPPLGYIFDPTRPVAGASFDPTGGPDPTSLGSAENPLNPGFLTDFSSGANPYYFTFELAAGDPLVINNNFPLRLQVPRKYVYWKEVTPGGGPDPSSNGDGDCYSDLIEYALNLNPASGVQTSPAFRGVLNPGTGKVDVSFNRVAGGVTDLTYTLMGLLNLTASPAGWTALTLTPTVTPNGDGSETVTFADVESDPFFTGQSTGLVRLKVDYDEDGDTISDLNASTPAFGWNRHLFAAECVMTGHPYLKDKNFCGTVDSVTGSVLDVTTSAGGVSVVAQFVGGHQYFVEVYSGDNAGQRFDIDEAASTATTIALDAASTYNTLTGIPASLAGDKVVVREHWTIDGLFDKDQFAATLNPNTADRLLFFDRTTSSFKIYWLLNHPSGPRWVSLGDASYTDRGARVIAPNEGWYTHPKGGPQEVVWHGMVRANACACPLQAGANFVGSGYPMDQSPALRGMTIAAGFTGNRDPGLADQLLFWKGYNSDQSMAYYNHFLLSAGALQRWTEQGNAALTNENNLPLFRPISGVVYKLRASLPGYVMPMPWTP